MRRHPNAALLLLGCGLLFLATRPALATCKLLQVTEFQTDLSHGEPVVEGTINGKPIRALIGTGFDRTFLYAAEARRLGLSLRQYSDRKEYIFGATVQIESAIVQQMQIGTLRVGKATIPALDTNGPEGIAFLLGSDFFEAYDTEFDLGHGVIHLFQPSDCKPEQLVYWNNGYFMTKLSTPSGNQPHVGFTVQLNGSRLNAWLSTSSPVSAIDKLAVQNLGLKLGTDAAPLLSQPPARPVWDGRFNTLEIGNESVHGVHLQVVDLFGRSTYQHTGSMLPQKSTDFPDLILGMDFLRAHRVMVLPGQHEMLFTYNGGPISTPPSAAAAGPDPKPAPSAEPATVPAQPH